MDTVIETVYSAIEKCVLKIDEQIEAGSPRFGIVEYSYDAMIFVFDVPLGTADRGVATVQRTRPYLFNPDFRFRVLRKISSHVAQVAEAHRAEVIGIIYISMRGKALMSAGRSVSGDALTLRVADVFEKCGRYPEHFRGYFPEPFYALLGVQDSALRGRINIRDFEN